MQSFVRNNLIGPCALALVSLLPSQGLCGQPYKVLYAFEGGTDGAYPSAALIADQSGNLYGSTENGGEMAACAGFGCGTLFKITPDGIKTILYTFNGGSDGGDPAQALMLDRDGNLFGSTFEGGDVAACGGYGCGVAFKLATGGTFTVLDTFTGGSGGATPSSPLLRNPHGVLIGTAGYGGGGEGVIYRLARNGKEQVLYSFAGAMDGADPSGSLVQDKKGDLTGTTILGGSSDDGSVYRLAADGTETVLHSFNGSDGWWPQGLIADHAGNFYGLTAAGGNPCEQSDEGCGQAFKLTGAGAFSVLHYFTGDNFGGIPVGSLVRDSKGNLYGSTSQGGNQSDCGGVGCGTVFKLGPDGTPTALYAFKGGSDGAFPESGLFEGADGYLYGTTSGGGGGTGCQILLTKGCGVVFKIMK
ncbi:MAG TPA: choice-of-anchor tandem repeat GloVer-containing protein [Rhizomicrobium sp.]|jgi:uncharacterized repeat protein (TIGR03803 family)|nr:choice-of-anchor tandem repeat GloVer-containing protein [Rhizomicrobium sp.]